MGRRLPIIVGAGALLVGMTWGAFVAFGPGVPHVAGFLERAAGRGPFVEQAAAALGAGLRRFDRGALDGRGELPAWALATTGPGPSGCGKGRTVASLDALRAALDDAAPGDCIALAPGLYRLERGLEISVGGSRERPVTLTSVDPPATIVDSTVTEAIRVMAPYWIFDGLVIRGRCNDHSRCEHAYHVVGAAHDVTITRNELTGFNAAIKVNGEDGRFPDRGTVTASRIFNRAVRQTAAPVVPIDIVGASDWIISANLIADFVKDGGDRTSYGAFAKGAARGTRFVANIVLCEHRLRGAPGFRVGLSLGNGGTHPDFCRDRRCDGEHFGGAVSGNLVVSCSDDGIYLNRAADAVVAHNTLIDTAGMSLRYPQTVATVRGNLIDGRPRLRDGAHAATAGNVDSAGVFSDASALDLRWRRPPQLLDVDGAMPDLCGSARSAGARPGAFDDFAACLHRGER